MRTPIGRLVEAIRATGQLGNTLVFYIVGDNGASAEGGMNGLFNEMTYFNGVQETVQDILKHYDDLGGPMTYSHYAAGWAVAGDTPFTWTKQVASSYGGTRNGMVIHWPKGIAAKGEVRSQWHHVIDIVPTILEAAKVPEPKSVNGTTQTPIEGVSMAYSFANAKAPSTHTTQYFEIFGPRLTGVLAATTLALLSPQTAAADENGISYWLPGLYGSLAATPTTPGWSIAAIYYHASVNASGATAASRQFQIGRLSPNVNVNLNVALGAQADLMLIAPTYTFATPVLGGQLSATLAGVYGRSSASLAGTLTSAVGPIVTTRNGFLEDALTSYGDLYPTLKLKWNNGVHNYMVYATGDIPVGDYSPGRLSNIGLGHGAIDLGGGYTYFNHTTGTEFSGVGGFTYNFKNPDTQYQSGVDFHFDWGVSQFLSKQVFVGFVGYGYQQITDDFRTASDSRWLPFAGFRHRPADRLHLPDRKQPGFSRPEGIWRVCCRKPARRLEYLADILDLGGGARQYGDTDQTSGAEVVCRG